MRVLLLLWLCHAGAADRCEWVLDPVELSWSECRVAAQPEGIRYAEEHPAYTFTGRTACVEPDRAKRFLPS
jgi:hypothetical protein